MKFNETKFDTISFGINDFHVSYTTPSGKPIEAKNYIKDLGVIIDNRLTFHQHISSLAAKGNQMARWTLRTFKSRQTHLMTTLLKSLIIPNVEYACVVWSPIDTYHMNLLEGVQRRYTSRFACFQTYDEV